MQAECGKTSSNCQLSGLQAASCLGRCCLPVLHPSHAAWAMHARLREPRQAAQVHSSTQHSQSSACPLQAAAHSRAPCQSTAERSCDQGWLGGNRSTADGEAHVSANLAGQTAITSAAVCRMHALSHSCCAGCSQPTCAASQCTSTPRCRAAAATSATGCRLPTSLLLQNTEMQHGWVGAGRSRLWMALKSTPTCSVRQLATCNLQHLLGAALPHLCMQRLHTCA